MTPAARLAMAIELLEVIVEAAHSNGPAADTLISRRFSQARFAGSKDRAAVRALIYAWLRDYQALAEVSYDSSARAIALSSLKSDEVETLFAGTGYGSEVLSQSERDWLAEPRKDVSAHGQVNLPEALLPAFIRRFGDDWPAASLGLNDRAPTDLRVNTLKTNREAAQAQLADQGVACQPTPHSPWGLRLTADAHVEATQAWRDGLVEIQDEASQLPALSCAVQPGETVVDLCAGAGGKTLALAMGRPGRLIAHDDDAKRLARLVPRAARAGVTAEFRSDGVDELGDLHGLADIVLVDAPCTGSGTWRRNPEARLRVTPETILAAQSLQIRLIEAAARLLKPGGRLVYAVCSVFEEEGADVIDAVRQRLPDLAVEPPLVANWRAEDTDSRRFLAFAPHSHGVDGFFIANLRLIR
jgi:16S rRNA (cytosine967-C5)-methyltransferase